MRRRPSVRSTPTVSTSRAGANASVPPGAWTARNARSPPAIGPLKSASAPMPLPSLYERLASAPDANAFAHGSVSSNTPPASTLRTRNVESRRCEKNAVSMLEPSCCCAPAAISVGRFQVPSATRGAAARNCSRSSGVPIRSEPPRPNTFWPPRSPRLTPVVPSVAPQLGAFMERKFDCELYPSDESARPFTKSLGVGVEKRPLTLRASVNGPSIATDSTDRLGRPALITEPAPSVMTGPGRRPLCSGSVTSTMADATARSPERRRAILVTATSPRSATSGMAAVTERSIDSPRASTSIGAPTNRAFHVRGASTSRSSVSWRFPALRIVNASSKRSPACAPRIDCVGVTSMRAMRAIATSIGARTGVAPAAAVKRTNPARVSPACADTGTPTVSTTTLPRATVPLRAPRRGTLPLATTS